VRRLFHREFIAVISQYRSLGSQCSALKLPSGVISRRKTPASANLLVANAHLYRVIRLSRAISRYRDAVRRIYQHRRPVNFRFNGILGDSNTGIVPRTRRIRQVLSCERSKYVRNTSRMESFMRRLEAVRDFSLACGNEGIIKTEEIRVL